MTLLSVAEAHRRLMGLFAPLEAETVPIGAAAGRVLARPLRAPRDQPPFAASAMDGYALRSADLRPGVALSVIGTAQAGARFAGRVGPGQAVRIFTGAPVPEGADRVVIQEDVAQAGATITLTDRIDDQTHIRPSGCDFRAGTPFSAPRLLTPAAIALLAAMNQDRVPVVRRPDIALIPTGDELVEPGETPGPDQIVTSNALGLQALAEGFGAAARVLPIARDNAESLEAVLDLAAGADLVVMIGGASVGAHDLAPPAVLAAGGRIAFHRIAMRPGKPLWAGLFRDRPILGLPGNPVSAMVCGHLFLVPAIRAMLGLGAAAPRPIVGRLGTDLAANGPREHYMRATARRAGATWTATPAPSQDSALLSVLAEADALMIRPPDDPPRRAGDPVSLLLLDQFALHFDRSD